MTKQAEIERLVEPIAKVLWLSDENRIRVAIGKPATSEIPVGANWSKNVQKARDVLQSDALTAPIKREEELREALDAIVKSAIIGAASESAETKQVALESIDDIASAALNPKTEGE